MKLKHPARNFFERMFRYPTGKNQPLENQLTESFVAIFEKSEKFRQEFFKSILNREPVGEVDIISQSPHFISNQPYPKKIDIEIVHEKSGVPVEIFFFEVKAWGSENSSTGENNDKSDPQLKNYRQILLQKKSKTGVSVSLLGLTPRINPLHGIGKYTEGLDSCRNVYWDEVGAVIKYCLKDIQSETEKFLLSEFVKYLEKKKIMIDKNLSGSDFDVFSKYHEVKSKFWIALEPVDTLLLSFNGKDKPYRKNFGGASQAEGEKCFATYRKFSTDNDLSIYSGFSFEDPERVWVGSWIEIAPKAKNERKLLVEAFLRSKATRSDSNDELLWNGQWQSFYDESEIKVLFAAGCSLSDFKTNPTPLDDIRYFLIKTTRDAYAIVEDSGLIK